jgi:1-acyl-sn-glycerol-3-phosphate acyltransferase
MDAEYSVAWYTRLVRAVLRPVFRAIFRAISRVQMGGLENVPKDGAYLIVINHISLFEPPFVISFWPVAAEALGAADIWGRTGQSCLVQLYGGIKLHRGEFDRQVLDVALAALRSGRPLLIAPEGGRSHAPGMRRALPGVAYLADKAGVPILPVGIVGSTDDFLKRALRGQRPLIEMRIGAPFVLPPILGSGDERRIRRQGNADRIMRQVAALLPPDYRGVYADVKA